VSHIIFWVLVWTGITVAAVMYYKGLLQPVRWLAPHLAAGWTRLRVGAVRVYVVLRPAQHGFVDPFEHTGCCGGDNTAAWPDEEAIKLLTPAPHLDDIEDAPTVVDVTAPPPAPPPAAPVLVTAPWWWPADEAAEMLAAWRDEHASR
jgi:hypothetical protein